MSCTSFLNYQNSYRGVNKIWESKKKRSTSGASPPKQGGKFSSKPRRETIVVMEKYPSYIEEEGIQ